MLDEGPPISQRLFQLAGTLSAHNHYRQAALAFSAASRTPRTTPPLQAYALYKAAQQLHASTAHCTDSVVIAEDTTRCLAYLQKALLLLRRDPNAFAARLQLYALLERVHTRANNHVAAANALKAAVQAVGAQQERQMTTASAAHSAAQLRWWVYFRARAVTNALATPNSLSRACALAEEAASQAERLQHFSTAAAFHLVQTQVVLGASALGVRTLHPNMEQACRNLSCIARVRDDPVEGITSAQADVALLRFAAAFLHALLLVRSGDVRTLKDRVMAELSKTYNRLRALRKRGVCRTSWTWIPHHFLSALTFYITTAVARADADGPKALVHAMTALSRLGITEGNLPSFTLREVALGSERQGAVLALTVALLESASRVRLTALALDDAARLIGAAVDLAFPDDAARACVRSVEASQPVDDELAMRVQAGCDAIGLAPRCTALLLMAEFHNLRGKVSAARIATVLLQAVRTAISSTSTTSSQGAVLAQQPARAVMPGSEFMTDTWQMAVSYLSMLNGDKRQDIANAGMPSAALLPTEAEGDTLFEAGFVSRPLLAMAYFTIGVYYMRTTDVLESRRALRSCLSVVHGTFSCGSEQVIANAMTVLSGLVLTRERISDEASSMTGTAVSLAKTLGDPVTTVRATRQHKKLAERLGYPLDQRQQANASAAEAFYELMEKQKSAGLVFSPPPTD